MQEYKSGEEVFLIHSRQYAWIVERRDDETWVVDLDGDLIPVHEDDLVPAEEADRSEGEVGARAASAGPAGTAAGSAGTAAGPAGAALGPAVPAAGPAVPASGPAVGAPGAGSGAQPEPGTAEGFTQVFVPLGNGRYQRWLVNSTPQMFRVRVELSGKLLADGQMLPNGQLDLGSMHRDDLHEQPALILTCRYTQGPHKLERSFQKDLRVRMAAFAKREAAAFAKREAASGATPTSPTTPTSPATPASGTTPTSGATPAPPAAPLIFSVFQKLPDAAADFSAYSPPDTGPLGQGRQKGGMVPGGAGRSSGQRDRAGREALPPELDLHIEKLVEHPEKLHPAEMLAVQLARATQYLDRAAWSGMPKVYLIHGLGTGRLREELHDMLRRHPRVRGFQNSHFPRYGFGATEVLLDH